MVEERLTTEQVIERVGRNDLTPWKLERWHKADIISRPTVEHLGYGKGTRSTYPAHVVEQVLAVCRLLEQKHKLDVVKFQLWREGFPLPLPALKKTLRKLVPPLAWPIPRGTESKYTAADDQTFTILRKATGRVRGSVVRTLLRRLKQKADQESFIMIQMYLLYGIRYEFTPSFDSKELSPADILSQGLGLDTMRFLPKDLTTDLQGLSRRGLLSLTKMNTALDEATEEDTLLARSRMEMMGPLFECFEIMGYLPHSWRLSQRYPSEPWGQALLLVYLILLEKQGFGKNMDVVFDAMQTNLPKLRVGQAVHHALSQELPQMTKHLLAFEKMGHLVAEQQAGNGEAGQQFEAYLEHLRLVYVQHKIELDAFWQRHPEWIIE